MNFIILYIRRLTKAGFPALCSWLQGTFSAPRDEAVRKVDNHSFEYFLPEGPPVKKANGIVKKNGNGKETKSKLEEYKEGLRDFQNGQIVKLGKKHVCILLNLCEISTKFLFADLSDAEEIYSSIIKDFPTYLTAHISLIQKLELAETKNALPFTYSLSLDKAGDLETTTQTLTRIVDLASHVIKETNVDAILGYYGLKTDSRPDAAKIKA